MGGWREIGEMRGEEGRGGEGRKGEGRDEERSGMRVCVCVRSVSSAITLRSVPYNLQMCVHVNLYLYLYAYLLLLLVLVVV